MTPSSPDRISKTQRWLDLIALLLGRRVPLTVEEIMVRVPAYAEPLEKGDPTSLASARRMFERDKDELRDAGIPVETVRYDINFGHEQLEGYRITRQDFYLPYLHILAGGESGETRKAQRGEYPAIPGVELRQEDAALALEALRRMREMPTFPFASEARSALRKLTFDIDPEGLDDASVLWVERPGAREVLERLRVISDSLLARKTIRFAYHGIHRGATTERDVAPYGLFFQRDWYLVGRDATRDAIRVFRVARIDDLHPNTRAPRTPDFAVPPDFHLDEYLDRSAWELGEGESLEADVAFRFPRSIWAERNGEGEWISERPDRSVVRRFRVSQPNPFLRWVLSLAGDAEILSPPELVAQYRDVVREVAALYGDGSGNG
jgi:proteasome accessory factor B